MSEQNPAPKTTGALSNPQILGAIITGIVSVVVAIVGVIPQFAKNDPTHTPTPLAGVVVTFTPTPAPVLEVLTLVATVTSTPLLSVTNTPLNLDPTPEPSRTFTPSPTVAVQTPNVRLFHNNRSFTALNLTNRRIGLNGVVFVGGDGRWSASEWGPIYQNMTSGDCLRMRDQNSGQQEPPSDCGDLLALVLVGDGAIFWRNDDGFTVSQDGVVLATCPQDSETCDLFIAQP